MVAVPRSASMLHLAATRSTEHIISAHAHAEHQRLSSSTKPCSSHTAQLQASHTFSFMSHPAPHSGAKSPVRIGSTHPLQPWQKGAPFFFVLSQHLVSCTQVLALSSMLWTSSLCARALSGLEASQSMPTAWSSARAPASCAAPAAVVPAIFGSRS